MLCYYCFGKCAMTGNFVFDICHRAINIGKIFLRRRHWYSSFIFKLVYAFQKDTMLRQCLINESMIIITLNWNLTNVSYRTSFLLKYIFLPSFAVLYKAFSYNGFFFFFWGNTGNINWLYCHETDLLDAVWFRSTIKHFFYFEGHLTKFWN